MLHNLVHLKHYNVEIHIFIVEMILIITMKYTILFNTMKYIF